MTHLSAQKSIDDNIKEENSENEEGVELRQDSIMQSELPAEDNLNIQLASLSKDDTKEGGIRRPHFIKANESLYFELAPHQDKKDELMIIRESTQRLIDSTDTLKTGH